MIWGCEKGISRRENRPLVGCFLVSLRGEVFSTLATSHPGNQASEPAKRPTGQAANPCTLATWGLAAARSSGTHADLLGHGLPSAYVMALDFRAYLAGGLDKRPSKEHLELSRFR